MELKRIKTFSENFPLKGNYEKKIHREILDNELDVFYLELFLKTKTQKEIDNLKSARNYFIKSGILICVMDDYEKIGDYSVRIKSGNSEFIKEFPPKNKLINISFQDYKKRVVLKFGDHKLIKESVEHYRELWIENYNHWVTYYYPKIKNRI